MDIYEDRSWSSTKFKHYPERNENKHKLARKMRIEYHCFFFTMVYFKVLINNIIRQNRNVFIIKHN